MSLTHILLLFTSYRTHVICIILDERLYDSARLKPEKATVASYTNFLPTILPQM
ncbi:hypothetical protein Cal6303_0892 [Calothrix sp. PCC 6303]|nr:hypothetical protein Cal6303_0892 [Calothrix sp. PCC 6303]